ncbi:VolA/Pla-1 family phospholipase [Photobacterium atrarenae]|uniref:Bacterial virulence factor lipase N-terminal domain-containing protein n=1 Tax=Photobacterium atrarenae TaxID=865757 RepID=A0ABY5GCC2_9GAMM|nr:VolA/Pla-1 family phospholipase [Photobacterium atrarenae]UTV26870.1 hypothetical protein NNL38_10965 [Photobacterium atrarenae]
MNKKMLALLIGANLALYGCDDTKISGEPTVDPAIERSLQAETKIAFDLLSDEPTLILPTFIAMDSTDGTLSSDGDSNDLSNPKVAMGKTDGWSTSQPISITFTGANLDEKTANNAFFLIKTDSPTLTKSATKQRKLTAEKGDFVIKVDGDTLKVILTKPLEPSANYMFALTDDLKDTKGNSVGMSQSYAYLKSDTPPPSPKLDKAQAYTHKIEATFAEQGLDKDKIIYSSWFTTASVGSSLSITKAVIAKTIEAVKAGGTPDLIWKGESNPNDADLSALYTMDLQITGADLKGVGLDKAMENDPILPNVVKSDADPDGSATITALKQAYATITTDTGLTVTVYKGTVNLPYFLDEDTANEGWKKTPWESATPSIAKISNVMRNGSDADKAALAQSLPGVDIAKLLTGDTTEMFDLIGLEGKLADGSQLDSERLITKYSPLPKIKAVKPVPVLVFMPDAASAPAPGAVIYQHGITSVKETSYLFAANHMAMAIAAGKTPKAIIAIDHPLHGERALDDGTVTTPATADVYMNLEYLNVARDNIRQSIIDNLGLRTSLTVMKSTAHPVLNIIDISKISFFGHSLGAITGVSTYGLGNQTLGSPTADALFNFSSGAFANPGGGIPSLLLESKTFGPTIKHSLLLGAKNAAYTADCGSALDGGACFTEFFNSLDSATQAQVNATFATFGYAAQTVLDTVDPYNTASKVSGPVYVMQALNDAVVPNQTTTFSVIGGTQPLVKQLNNQEGLAKITTSQLTVVEGIAEFNDISKAQHSSAIAPQYKDAAGNVIDSTEAINTTKEIQTEIATFSAMDGQGIIVGDRTLIQ